MTLTVLLKSTYRSGIPVGFKGIVSRCKTILHLIGLTSSKTQSTWVQEVRPCPISRYSAQKYKEIECVKRKYFVDGPVEKPVILNYEQPKSKNTNK